jgi:glycosyltransferase involved in cell wall biosynthesis
MISTEKLWAKTARAAFRRFHCLGEIINEFTPVIYLVPKEPGASPAPGEKLETFYQFSWKNRFIHFLTDFNPCFIIKLWSIRRRFGSPRNVWMSRPYGIIITKVLFPHASITYLSHDVMKDTIGLNYLVWGAKKSLVERLLPVISYGFEIIACRLCNQIVAISEEDREKYLAIYNLTEKTVAVIPTPLDEHIVARTKHYESENPVIVFHCNYDYPPNRFAVDFIVNELAPQLAKTNPSILIRIAGEGVPVSNNENVEAVGFVDNIGEFLEAADIAIIPLPWGTGLRTKALDYMAAGVPIIATRAGIGGIPVQDGRDVIIAELCAAAFVQAIEELLRNHVLRESLAKNSLTLVNSLFSRDAIRAKLIQIIGHNQIWD